MTRGLLSWAASRFGDRFWLVADPAHIEARDGTGISDGLSLRVVKEGRYTNHYVPHLETRICLSRSFHKEVDKFLIPDYLMVDVTETPILEGVFIDTRPDLVFSSRSFFAGIDQLGLFCNLGSSFGQDRSR